MTNELITKHAELFALGQLFSSYPSCLTYEQIIDIYDNECEELANERLEEIDDTEMLSICERYDAEWHSNVKYVLEGLKDNFYYHAKEMLMEYETL